MTAKPRMDREQVAALLTPLLRAGGADGRLVSVFFSANGSIEVSLR
jgi:hypothetical protein